MQRKHFTRKSQDLGLSRRNLTTPNMEDRQAGPSRPNFFFFPPSEWRRRRRAQRRSRRRPTHLDARPPLPAFSPSSTALAPPHAVGVGGLCRSSDPGCRADLIGAVSPGEAVVGFGPALVADQGWPLGGRRRAGHSCGCRAARGRACRRRAAPCGRRQGPQACWKPCARLPRPGLARTRGS